MNSYIQKIKGQVWINTDLKKNFLISTDIPPYPYGLWLEALIEVMKIVDPFFCDLFSPTAQKQFTSAT